MHPVSSAYPSQTQLLLPLLDVVHQAGACAPREAADRLVDRLKLAPETRTRRRVTDAGVSINLWRRHVRYARLKAVALGFIGATPGRWTLTDSGTAALGQARPAAVLRILTDQAGHVIGAQVTLRLVLPTVHSLTAGDSRALPWIPDGSIPLIATSCPYFDLRTYDHAEGQLGSIAGYTDFLDGLDQVWREAHRILAPGGRLACVVGDVLRSRARHGTHHVLPLHADILTRATGLGFAALTGIVWAKPTNCRYRGSPALGRPGQPNQVIKSELEHILLLKKPGGYRSPSPAQAAASRITTDEHAAWWRPIWSDVRGARAASHPAPYPVPIPYRLIRMFSLAGDTVLDPFCGSGTTSVAAALAGRHSIAVDVSPRYIAQAADRLRQLPGSRCTIIAGPRAPAL